MSKKLWIDALTPKQALFTRAMLERAPSKFKLTVTTRDYYELNSFMKKIKLRVTSLGRHGGGDIIQKLKASIERQRELAEFAMRGDFDFSFSFISPEAARISFGIALPHFICSDSPHAKAASKLAVPLCSKLFSPFPIERSRWTQYGLKTSQVQSYHALDPWAWLVSRSARASRERGKSQKILIRLEESFASYMKSGKGVSDSLHLLVKLISKSGDYDITVIPRYDEQRRWVERKFGKYVTVTENGAVDGADEVEGAKLVIGGGGTMTQEAALLGAPNVSYFPSATLDVFENFYFPKHLSLKASTPQELIYHTRKLLQNLDKECDLFKSRARQETKDFEDPVKFVFKGLTS